MLFFIIKNKNNNTKLLLDLKMDTLLQFDL